MLPFRFGTTTLVVDDDQLFLDSFSYSIGRSLRCRTNNFPPDAIAQLRNAAARWESLLAPAAAHGRDDYDRSPHNGKQDRRLALAALAADAARHDLIGVVIVDFAMPNMSGLEVCREIRGLPFKKILLTGKTGDKTAVAAFNEGLIDRFLVKQDPELPRKLPSEVLYLEQEFLRQRASACAAIVDDVAFLGDRAVSAHLEAMWRRLNIAEHYLWTHPPGFLTIDAAGKRRQVIIYDTEMMRAQSEVAHECEAPVEFTAAVRNNTAIAWFPGPTGLIDEHYFGHWRDYTSAAERIPGSDFWVTVRPA